MSAVGEAGAVLSAPGIGDEEFSVIAAIMRRVAGIELHERKRALVEARINRRLRVLGLKSYREYLARLEADADGSELIQLIDAISTNVTSFFREPDHFYLLARETAGWLSAGRRRLRFWSAACSSGEEPYSLAMTLAEVPAARGADIRILATDISTRVLSLAVKGNYRESMLAAVPAAQRRAWFRSSGDGPDRLYRVSDELKRMIMFRRLNLNRTPYPIRGIFDAVLCRNVMIYFGQELRRRIVAEMSRLVRPGGYLLIGHAETLLGIEDGFEFVRPSVYRRRDDR